jgi:hypothetical protein
VVVVEHPGGQGDGRVQQGVADRLRPGGLFQEVAEPRRPECSDRGLGRAFLLGVRRLAPAAQRRPKQVEVDAEQSLRGLVAQCLGDGGTLVPPLRDEVGIAEPTHQLRPGARDPTDVPADLAGRTGESVAGQRRENHAVQTPQMDRYGYTEQYLRGRIIGALGGRAAEEVVYGEVSTGAESDLDQATQIARQMVGRWGMSSAVGPVSVLPRPGQEQPFGQDRVSPSTRDLVDGEVRRLIVACSTEAVATLRDNRDRLDRLAHTLLERETLGEDEAYAAAGLPRETAPAAIARGEAPGSERVPGLPPEGATAGVG